MNVKKLTAAASALAIAAGMSAYIPAEKAVAPVAASAASGYNYAEALQKSMFF